MHNDEHKGTIYLAGKMRGLPYYNFKAFDAVADRLRAVGWTVINPADVDRANGFDPYNLPADSDWNLIPEGFDLKRCIRDDIQAVLDCDAIFMLTGWEASVGARAEHATAQWAMKTIYYQTTLTEAYNV